MKERRIPHSRVSRLGHIGKLAGGVAGGAIAEGFRQWSRGNRPAVKDLLLTPANAQRLSDRLAEMRGAAMKIGQLLSMESGEVLPPELTEVLARLRKDAYHMPLGQVAGILEEAWGEGWDKQFKQFRFTPLAAASIGQVHEAVTREGDRLAIKVQYPGISQSINSDVDNVASILGLFNLIPREIDFAPLLNEAKQQLQHETDYLAEASASKKYAKYTQDDSRFQIPLVFDSLTKPNVLTMEFMEGVLLDAVDGEPQSVRDDIAVSLLELGMREIFEWGFFQSDPNIANFLYQPSSRKIQLLDFGAAREISIEQRESFRQLLYAAAEGNDNEVETAAVKIGYMDFSDPLLFRQGIVEMIRIACTPIRQHGDFVFSDSVLAQEITDSTMALRLEQKFGRMPPPAVLYLHRKLAGLYLIFTALKATIPVRATVLPFIDNELSEKAEN